jgi:hypothetical protein
MMGIDTIDTTVGPAIVLHRLALGVECIDALVDRLVTTPVRVGRHAVARRLPRQFDVSISSGPGQRASSCVTTAT